MEKITLPELPVLDDFALFLNFLRSKDKTPVTSTNGYLKMADLYRLNQELHFKADWVNPRSQQRHYLVLEFFYHVVTISKIVRLYHDQKGSYLSIVPEKLEKYDLLTPTEQYFFLLETFWCRLNWENLNDNYYFPFTDDVLELLELVATGKPGQEYEVKNGQLTVTGAKKKKAVFLNGSTQKFIQVLGFLGFLDFQTDTSLTKRPDSFSFIYKKITGTLLATQLGPSLLLERPLEQWNDPLIRSREEDFIQYNFMTGKKESLLQEDEIEPQRPDEPFIEAFKPLFEPEELSEEFYEKDEDEMTITKGCFHLKVALDRNLFRTIAIGVSATLADLHLAIQDAFDFDDDHLYAFYMNPKRWSGESYGPSYGEDPPFADDVKLGELDLYKGRKFKYLFDFGDSWRFDITVKNFDPEQPEPNQPAVVEAKGENPEQYPDYDEEGW